MKLAYLDRVAVAPGTMKLACARAACAACAARAHKQVPEGKGVGAPPWGYP